MLPEATAVRLWVTLEREAEPFTRNTPWGVAVSKAVTLPGSIPGFRARV